MAFIFSKLTAILQTEGCDLEEVLSSCSRKQQDHIWQRIQALVTAHTLTQVRTDKAVMLCIPWF